MSNPCLTRAPSPRPHRPHTHTALTASSVSSYQIQRKGTAATPTTFPRGPRLHFSNFFFFSRLPIDSPGDQCPTPRSHAQMAPSLVQIARRGTAVNRSALRRAAGQTPGLPSQSPASCRGKRHSSICRCGLFHLFFTKIKKKQKEKKSFCCMPCFACRG